MSGAIKHITFEEYNAVDALRSSFIREMSRSPLHAMQERKTTAAMRRGSGLHTSLLEPELFDSKFAVLDDLDGRTKAGIADRDAKRAAKPGAELLTHDQALSIAGMVNSIMRHPLASKLFGPGGETELSLFWEQSVVPCKARLDRYAGIEAPLHCNVVADVKSTLDASPKKFARTMFDYGYHIQQAWYEYGALACGLKIERFLFVAVESAPPYACMVHELDEAALEFAREEIERNFQVYKQCRASGIWPGYNDGINLVLAPAWLNPIEVYE